MRVDGEIETEREKEQGQFVLEVRKHLGYVHGIISSCESLWPGVFLGGSGGRKGQWDVCDSHT